MKFVSIDPSLCNTALVCGKLKNGQIDKLFGYELVHTKKDYKKGKAAEGFIERCNYIYTTVHNLLYFDSEQCFYNPDIIFVETPSGSQSYSGALSYSVSCFLVGTLKPKPLQVTPKQVKELSVGNKEASKNEMIDWVQETFPDFELPMYRDKINAGKAEHVADSIAIAYSGSIVHKENL